MQPCFGTLGGVSEPLIRSKIVITLELKLCLSKDLGS